MSSETETSKSPEVIHNETPALLILKGDHGNVLTLAPLEKTQPISATTLKEFDFRPLKHRNLLRSVEVKPRGRLELTLLYLLGAAFWFVVLGTIFSLLKASWVGRYWRIGSIVLCVALVVVFLGTKQMAITVFRVITQSLTVSFILVFGIGMPAATVYFFGNSGFIVGEKTRSEAPLSFLS